MRGRKGRGKGNEEEGGGKGKEVWREWREKERGKGEGR
jgi:hypothetical protein